MAKVLTGKHVADWHGPAGGEELNEDRAEDEEIIITRHGKPAGILIGFKSEDDWLDYRLENDPRFLKRVLASRESLQAGKGVRIEDLELDME